VYAHENWFVRLISPSGRVNRTTYACMFAVASVGWIAAVFLFVVIATALPTAAAIEFGVVVILFGPATAFWLWVATSVKRLHDQGLPAPVILMVLIPVVGSFAMTLLCLVGPGNQGPNQHGAAPGPGFHL